MMERIEDREAAGRFAENWRANWSRVDIDTVVAHFSEDAETRSPLAEKLTGSAVVQGADNIRQYWQKAYGHVKSADLQILTWSWDDNIRRLTIWWSLNGARASEFMDFDASGRVVRSEAFYGK